MIPAHACTGAKCLDVCFRSRMRAFAAVLHELAWAMLCNARDTERGKSYAPGSNYFN